MFKLVVLVHLPFYFYLSNFVLQGRAQESMPTVIKSEIERIRLPKYALPVIIVFHERKTNCPQDSNNIPKTQCTDASNLLLGSSENKDESKPCNSFSSVEEEDPELDYNAEVVSEVCYKKINTSFLDTFKNGEDNVTTILGLPGDRLKFKCFSSHLTRWTTTILPTKEAAYTESKRYDQNPFESDNLTFVNEFDLVIQEGNSGWIRCEGFHNSTIKTEIYVFSQAGPELVGDEDEVEEVLIENLNANLKVPCVANFPNIQAILEEETDHFQFEPVSLSRLIKPYDPSSGFLVQGRNESEQTYRCVSNGQSVVFNLFYSNTTKKQSGVSGRTTASESHIMLYTESSAQENKDLDKRGDIYCRLNVSENNDVMFLKMIRCTSPNECDWLSVCFQKCWLSHDVERQEITRTSTLAFLNNPFPTGVIVCVLPQENLAVINYYFTGLDRLSYFISDPVPSNAIIKLETSEQHFYTYQSTEFLCGISTFLLVSNIKFAAIFKNKTRVLIGTINSEGDNNIEEYEERGFSQRKVRVNLTREVVGISCMAPYYNSSGWKIATIEIDSKDIVLPSIDQSQSKKKVLDITFRHGETNAILHCSANGDPKPEINWEFPNKDIISKIRYTQSTEGESTLIFPTIEDNVFQGIYTCIATSQFGNATQEMRVLIEDSSLTPEKIAAIICFTIVFLAVLAIIILLGVKYKVAKEKIRDLTEEEINEFNQGLEVDEDQVKRNAKVIGPEEAKKMGFKKSYIIDENDLIIAKNAVLGQGEFGMVFRGILNGEAVAVKTTKSNADVAYVKALLAELKIMAYIGDHDHIVHFMGAVVSRIKERIVYCIVELCPLGNLHSYLRKIAETTNYANITVDSKLGDSTSLVTKPVSPDSIVLENEQTAKRQPRVPRKKSSTRPPESEINKNGPVAKLIYWCQQIAAGMEYLAQKKVIHGDLATRNVLVFKDEVMKITDFGLSRQLYGYSKYVKKQRMPLPWRWMALESLRFLEFSNQSDVWSFGVTMWEIFAKGQTPYPGQNWTLNFVDELSQGLRLQSPQNTPKAVYDLMVQCWKMDPIDRPTFGELKAYLEDLRKITVN